MANQGESVNESISFWGLVTTFSVFKILLIKSYRSTDFHVHQNWLAITHSLPLSKWYYEETSEWTLDYPPFFAYFEWLLSQVAFYFDKNMLNVQNVNYASAQTILFQKLSVIVVDLLFAYSIISISESLRKNIFRWSTLEDLRFKLFIVVFLNGGLFIIDHIHFQYNGFLYGVLLLSMSKILEDKLFQGAFLFSILLNLKHIYLYIAPAFGVYLFRRYCLQGSGLKLKLHFGNLAGLVAIVLAVFGASFGPFFSHIPQILKRLFPFGRGLSHAFWAPNIWAVYNSLDLVLNFVQNKGKSGVTGGLVGENPLAVLPAVQPIHTFLLTLLFMVPSLLKIVWTPTPRNFLNGIILTAWTSFMFGYHVHEKAILNVIIPFSIISWKEPKLFFIVLVSGTFSIFPLLFTPFEIVLKLLFSSLHVILCYFLLCKAAKFYWFEKLYLLGFLPLFLIENICPLILTRYPFIPLILVSDYCFIGIFLCYVKFYWNTLVAPQENTEKRVEQNNEDTAVQNTAKKGLQNNISSRRTSSTFVSTRSTITSIATRSNSNKTKTK